MPDLLTVGRAGWEYVTRTEVSGSPGIPTTRAEEYAKAVWEATVREENDPPFKSGFTKRKKLHYDLAKRPKSDLTDFPKLFKIAGDTDIASELASGGGIAVTAPDGTTDKAFGLYPSSDLDSGDVILRVKVDDYAKDPQGGGFYGYLYYDSAVSTATYEDKSGTVSNGYALFMPLEEDPSGSAPQMLDWVTETNLGTSAGTMTSGDSVAAQVGKGLDFDATDDAITVPDAAALDPASITVSALVRVRSYAGNAYQQIVGKALTNWESGWALVANPDSGGRVGFWVNSYSNPTSGQAYAARATYLPVNTWVHLVGTFDGVTIRFYAAGVERASDAGTTALIATTYDLRCGLVTALAPLDGVLDEVTVSSVARSANWIDYTYKDQFDNANTFDLGAEEEDAGGTGDVTVSLSALSASGTVVAPITSVGTTFSLSVLIGRGVVVTPNVTVTVPVTVTPLSGTGTLVAPTLATIVNVSLDPLETEGILTPTTISIATGGFLSPLSASGTVVAPITTTGWVTTLTPFPVIGTIVVPSVETGSTVLLPSVASIGVVVPPTMTVGSTVSPSPLSGTGTLVSPSVSAVQVVVLSPLSGTGVVVSPTLFIGSTVEVSPLSVRGVLVSPVVFGGIITLPPTDTVTLNFEFTSIIPMNFEFTETVRLDF